MDHETLDELGVADLPAVAALMAPDHHKRAPSLQEEMSSESAVMGASAPEDFALME